ncbi:MAG TPA: glycosyltransferase [Gemmataceae bacterium]|jgi:glycosyltransferase involved in cell wall biosynthesis
MHKLKILYYNWTDFEDERQHGGGASVYQRNLIDAAVERGDEAWFLSSGDCYSPFSSRPFLREAKARKEGVRKFQIVNSTIVSPGPVAFSQDAATSPEMESLFAAFLSEHGPFDVVHFNNLEGIPVSFLRLAREHYPPAKILFSVHNYFAFCPQVNLWFQDRAACRDFHDGRKCVNCLTKSLSPRRYQRFYRFDYVLRMLGIPPLSAADRFLNRFFFLFLRSCFHSMLKAYGGADLQSRPVPVAIISRRPTPPAKILQPEEAARFASRRRLFVTALNTYADHVLAVSHRVAELAVGFGIDPAKVKTLYIGTRFADPNSPLRRDSKSGDASARLRHPAKRCDSLHIAYLGYMRPDKGFYFLLDALKKMPKTMANRLALTFAARATSPDAIQSIKSMAHRFVSVTFYDGYNHSQFADILSEIDLAVVPVLWEDNLPQVAMECVASGVPVLTSDLGGAQELLNCPELIFRAGSRADFYAKLQVILDNPSILSTALAGRARLYTPREHYDLLRENFYRDVTPDVKKGKLLESIDQPAAQARA